MNRKPDRIILAPSRLALCVGLCLVVLLAPSARADRVTFVAGTPPASQSATVNSYVRDGVAYVPLGAIVKQLGGTATSTPASLAIQYEGKTAQVTFGATSVAAGGTGITLSAPTIGSNGEAWIALDDVVPLFRRLFRVALGQENAPSAPPATANQEPSSTSPTSPAPTPGAAQPATPLVVIDPGHGGNDAGVQGQSLQEKDLTLAVAQRLQKALGARGIQSVLTRNGDESVSLIQRVNTAIESHGNLLISLHAGASFADSATGIDVYYPTDQNPDTAGGTGGPDAAGTPSHLQYALRGKDLAEAVARALTAATGAPLRGIHAIRNRLLEHIPMPGVVVELGILTNPTDENALASEAYQDRLASGLAQGVQQYLAASGTVQSGGTP